MKINRVLISILFLAGILAVPVRAELNYLHLYMVGEATPAGWDNAHELPEEMTPVGNGCFLWDGYLEEGQLKFINTRGDWGSSLMATENDLRFETGKNYRLNYQSANDYKFYNTRAGWVRVVVDLRNLTVNFRRPVLALVGEAVLGWGDPKKKVIPVFADDEGNVEWSGQLRYGGIKFLAGNCDDWSPCYNAPFKDDLLSDGGHSMHLNQADDYKYRVPCAGCYTLKFKRDNVEADFYAVEVATEAAPSLDGAFTGKAGRYLAALDLSARRVHVAPVPEKLYIGTSGSDCQEFVRVDDGRFSSEVVLEAGKYYKLSSSSSLWENCALSPNTDVDISATTTANVAPMHGYSYIVPADGTYAVTADFSGAAPSLHAERQTPSFVSSVSADRVVSVTVVSGEIFVEGEYDFFRIYDVAGRLVGQCSPCHVGEGIYLVKTDNNVLKIIVR